MTNSTLCLAAALATLTTPVVAQNVDYTLLLQTPEQGYHIDGRILTAVGTEQANLLMRILPDFAGPIEGFILASATLPMTVTLCDQFFEMDQPATYRPDGLLSVPFPNAATAEAAAEVMAQQTTCAAFPDAPEPSIASLLPPITPTTPPTGLTIRSPSGSYTVPASDILTSDIALNDGSGRHDMTFTFGPTTADWISAATAAHVGATFELLVCGDVVNAPVIQAPLNGRFMIITGLVDRAEADAELARILGEAPCP